jgi:JAB1/Mov34/MPN/PAD-1 ubiquitin protease
MEVMGLMLGEFVDDYTVRVIDVFAMPQSGTGVSVEAVDPVFQTKMLDMLKQTGRSVSPPSPLPSLSLSPTLPLSPLPLPLYPSYALSDQRWWWDGITVTLVLDVGCLV